MLRNNKKIYILFCLALFLCVNCNVIYASPVIYQGDRNVSGPGVIVTDNYDIIPIDNNWQMEIDSVYTHDGVQYVKGECVGNFSLSGYCACKKCGSGTGITASGKPVRENHTIAADWNILPKGTMVIIENAVGKDGTVYDGVYQVEDRGGGIKNQKIDIYRPNHDLASLVTYYGKCCGDVYIAMPIEENKKYGG